MGTPGTTRTLAQLIREHQAETGRSYQDIAVLTGLSKAKIGQLADPHRQHQPRETTLRKLAVGLHIPYHVIQSAAALTAGIVGQQDVQDQDIDIIVSRLRDLTPGDRRTVYDLVTAMWHRYQDDA